MSTDSNVERPGIGVAMIVFGLDHKGQKNILLGRRKGGRGNGTWALPGGKLDFGETVRHCAIRELKEETGLDFSIETGIQASVYKTRLENTVLIGPYVENLFPEDNTHWITLVTKIADVIDISKYPTSEMLKEPDKCFGWQWFLPYQIPDPMFGPLRNLLNQHGLEW